MVESDLFGKSLLERAGLERGYVAKLKLDPEDDEAKPYRIDEDDVDEDDVAIFINCLSGEGVLATPGCGGL